MALLLVGSRAPAQDAAPADPQTIRVAVEGAYPPFNFIDQNNELQGFEVDLLKALCDVMKVRCSLVPHDWDGIIRGLLDHEYDAIMSSLEITERRKRRIAFSRRYYRVPPALIGPKHADLGHLARRLSRASGSAPSTAANTRATSSPYTSERSSGPTASSTRPISIFSHGRLDYVIGDKLALTRFLSSREGACCRFVADVPADPAYFGHGFGIGLRREDEVLKASSTAPSTR